MLTPTEELELKILSIATPETRKFAVPLRADADQELIDAFERGLQLDWYRLIDVTHGAVMHPEIRQEYLGSIMKIFRLTEAGETRLRQLEKGALLHDGPSSPNEEPLKLAPDGCDWPECEHRDWKSARLGGCPRLATDEAQQAIHEAIELHLKSTGRK